MEQLVRNDDGSVSLKAWSMSEKQQTAHALEKILNESRLTAAQLAHMCTREADDDWVDLPDLLEEVQERTADVPERKAVSACMKWSFVWGTGWLLLSFT